MFVFFLMLCFVLYISFYWIIYPMNNNIQTAYDIIPSYEQCDSKINQFQNHVPEFATMAKYDYNHLRKNFKGKFWHFDDPKKRKII